MSNKFQTWILIEFALHFSNAICECFNAKTELANIAPVAALTQIYSVSDLLSIAVIHYDVRKLYNYLQ